MKTQKTSNRRTRSGQNTNTPDRPITLFSTCPRCFPRTQPSCVGYSVAKDRFSAGSQHTSTMQAVMSFSTRRTHLNKINHNSFLTSSEGGKRNRRSTTWKVNALPDWPLMAVMVEHVAGSRDWVVTKSVWHLNDEEIKNVYTMYIMFTCWGCCFFASMKDPFYDGEAYRKDGGDGSVHWLYDKQEEIEEQARAELWREELIEEIEKKVGGLRELEEAKEEELVK